MKNISICGNKLFLKNWEFTERLRLCLKSGPDTCLLSWVFKKNASGTAASVTLVLNQYSKWNIWASDNDNCLVLIFCSFLFWRDILDDNRNLKFSKLHKVNLWCMIFFRQPGILLTPKIEKLHVFPSCKYFWLSNL